MEATSFDEMSRDGAAWVVETAVYPLTDLSGAPALLMLGLDGKERRRGRGRERGQPVLHCRMECRKNVLQRGLGWGPGNLDLGMMSGQPGHWVASGEGWGRAGGNKMSKLCPKSCVGGILRG